MLESLFNKVTGLQACNLIKNRLFKNFLRIPFLRNLRTAASEDNALSFVTVEIL